MPCPSVSAIIPCFNTRDCVVKAVNSALNQQGADMEAIIVDDGSSDGSADLVEETFRDDSRVRLIRLGQNRGPSAARNIGFAAARNDWIGLLDSDDLWKPERVSTLLEHQASSDFIADNLMGYDAAADLETGPVYSDMGDRSLALVDFLLPSAPDRHDLGYLQPLLRRSFIEQHGLKYREDVRAGEDLLLNVQILAAGGRATYIDKALYIYLTPVGAVSRQASPYSRSTAHTGPLIKALEELRTQIEARLSSEERKAFDIRLADLREQAPIGAFHRARAKRRFGEMLALTIREPAVRRKIMSRLISRT